MTAANSGKLTPAMRQYRDMKGEIPEGAILLFRMGDFYELFFEDAREAAPLMDVVLTKRGGVPMCGVPHHSVQLYVKRLLDQGRKVAIAEQLEDPKQAKGLVKRGITRVVTPGTILEDDSLQASRSNFLVCVCPHRKKVGVALLDVSTGDFRGTELADRAGLEVELHRLQPAECLVPQSVYDDWSAQAALPDCPPRMVWTPVEDWTAEADIAEETLCRHFEVAGMDGFGCRGMDAAVRAAGAALHYARNSLRQDAGHVTGFRIYHNEETMTLDRITQRNLELVEPIFTESGDTTLVGVLDRTQTPMGTRLLREWIVRPLRRREPIEERLDAVEALARDPMLLAELREALTAVRDIERIITRLNVGSANARDLLALQHGLNAVPGVRHLLENADTELTGQVRHELVDLPEVADHIERAIVEDPPNAVTDGGLFREGYDEHLDELRRAGTEGKSWIASLESEEQTRTGIKSLKVRYNKVFGYFIEVTKANLDHVPEDYIRKQTLVNAERFITPKLKELEDTVLGSEEKSKALEYELFQALRGEAVACTVQIQSIARALAVVDVLTCWADVAGANHYCRPEILETTELDIREGRHPVLERQMEGDQFVPNDTYLNTEEDCLAIITGPNMAGKSTYIRQVALIVILAQAGSFVPAESARVGLVDRVFTRVGAADDIARGQSTFMVEMVETANILNNATPRSLIVLDEIGRGTSTFDGLSLAWAVAEHIHDAESLGARTLFATHYHEITELALTMKGVKNYNVAVREYGEKIIFLRKILEGPADQSYGIHVARLAGLPRSVIRRAAEVLSNLENNAVSGQGKPKLAERTASPPSGKRCSRKSEVREDSRQRLLFDF